MSANQMVGTVSGPHQGLDSGYIEKSITQFRKPQRAKKAKHFVRQEVDMPENSKYYPKVGK